jgi:hypothetical protein
MDLNSLKDTVANLSLYDIKAGVRKVQNGTLLRLGLPGRWEDCLLTLLPQP